MAAVPAATPASGGENPAATTSRIRALRLWPRPAPSLIPAARCSPTSGRRIREACRDVILDAVREQISDPAHVAYVLNRVEEEIAKLRADLPDALKLKEGELTAEQRRLANFVESIGARRGSQALANALVETERRADALTDEVDALRRSREEDLPSAADRVDQGPREQAPGCPRAAHSPLGSGSAGHPRPDPDGARDPRYRPALLPRRHNACSMPSP